MNVWSREQWPSSLPEIWFSLPSVSEEDFTNLVEDASIKRWIWEAEAARLQNEASQAAARGDWGAVDGALVKVRRIYFEPKYEEFRPRTI